jgi:hypothetical protein
MRASGKAHRRRWACQARWSRRPRTAESAAASHEGSGAEPGVEESGAVRQHGLCGRPNRAHTPRCLRNAVLSIYLLAFAPLLSGNLSPTCTRAGAQSGRAVLFYIWAARGMRRVASNIATARRPGSLSEQKPLQPRNRVGKSRCNFILRQPHPAVNLWESGFAPLAETGCASIRLVIMPGSTHSQLSGCTVTIALCIWEYILPAADAAAAAAGIERCSAVASDGSDAELRAGLWRRPLHRA